MFPTHLAATHSSAEEPFDVVDRPIERGPASPWRDTWNPTHPCHRFVDVSDGKVGLALITDGLHEYEVTDDSSRTIGLTLFRAFEVALTTVAWRWERHPEMKGSQVLGHHQFHYCLYPHAGTWETGRVPQQADQFSVPLELVQTGPASGRLPAASSCLALDPEDLQLSCLKRAEEGDAIIVRVYNPTGRDIDGLLTLFVKPISARRSDLAEEGRNSTPLPTCGNTIRFAAGAKKIITIEITAQI
jgi:mannosylglycerate hydrolase